MPLHAIFMVCSGIFFFYFRIISGLGAFFKNELKDSTSLVPLHAIYFRNELKNSASFFPLHAIFFRNELKNSASFFPLHTIFMVCSGIFFSLFHFISGVGAFFKNELKNYAFIVSLHAIFMECSGTIFFLPYHLWTKVIFQK